MRSSGTARVALDALGFLSRRTSFASNTILSMPSTTASSCCCCSRSVTGLSPSSLLSTSIIESMPLATHVPQMSFRSRLFASVDSSLTQSLSPGRRMTEKQTHGFAVERRTLSSSQSSASASTSGDETEGGDLPDEAAFHAAADDELHELVDVLESWIDEKLDSDEADVEYSSGVLTLRLGDGQGTYVINKQAPNRQLWLSSPVSGPVRYDLVKGSPRSTQESSPLSSSPRSSSPSSLSWIYHRDGHEMRQRLREELSGLFGEAPEGL